MTHRDAPAAHVRMIVSGGQSGVDRAAIDVAIAHGVAYSGWVPRGGWAEDHPAPPGVLTRYPALRATDEADTAVRTERNVDDADALLVVRSRAVRSAGTDLACSRAEARGMPCLVIDPHDERAHAALSAFLASLPSGSTLCVAGPREREQPGAYAATRALLEAHAAELFRAEL